MGMSVGVRALAKFRRVVTVSGASEWQGQEGLLLKSRQYSGRWMAV